MKRVLRSTSSRVATCVQGIANLLEELATILGSVQCKVAPEATAAATNSKSGQGTGFGGSDADYKQLKALKEGVCGVQAKHDQVYAGDRGVRER